MTAEHNIDIETHPQAYQLLGRDVDRICRYFARQGIQADPGRITRDLWRRFVGGEL